MINLKRDLAFFSIISIVVIYLNREVLGLSKSSTIIKNLSKLYSLSSNQKKSIAAIMTSWSKFGDGDKNKLAYILATAKHESRFEPVRECFASSDESARNCVSNRSYGFEETNGHVFYGRGFVQLTWKSNYYKMGLLLGIDLVNNPDRALDKNYAASILVIGMMKGIFTGKKLSDYIGPASIDFYKARKTVNGLDKAALIESYANQIIAIL